MKLLIALLLAYSGMKAQSHPASEFLFLFSQNLATHVKGAWSPHMQDYQFATQNNNLATVISSPAALGNICEMQRIWVGSGTITLNSTLLMYDVNANNGVLPSNVPTNATLSFPYNGWTYVGNNPGFNTVMQFQPGDYYFCLYHANQTNHLQVMQDLVYMKLTVIPALDVIVPTFCLSEDVTVEVVGCGEEGSRIIGMGGVITGRNINWSNGSSGTNITTYYWPFGQLQWVDATYLIEKFADPREFFL